MTASVASVRTGTQRTTGLSPDPSRPQRPFFANNGTTYTRPADWLAMPTLTPGTDRKIHALAAVYNNGSNLYAVNCTTGSGTYTVDWGDGQPAQTYTSGTIASYTIAWANVGSGTLTTRGYRQAMITITPTTAGQSLTAALFNVRGTNDTSTAGNPHNILEVSVCDVGLARLTFGAEAAAITNAAYNPNLEQVNLIETAAAIRAAGSGNNFDYMFGNCYSLQSVVGTINGASSGTYSATSMFQNCRSLRRAPVLNLPFCTFAVNMFNGCSALQEVNLDNVSSSSSVANWGQTFQNCTSLQNAPRFALNGANCESWSSTFQGCTSLKNVPYINASDSRVTFFNNMFLNCRSLRNAPVINMPVSGSFACTSMFSGCNSLRTVPTFNLTRCNSTSAMFSNCWNLQSYGAMTFAVNTNATGMFEQCYNLRSIGTIDLGNQNPTLSNLFLNCTSLQSFPGLLNSNSLTSTATMFQGCSSLVTVAPFVVNNLSAMNSMFDSCNSLVAAPDITITTGRPTTCVTMFNACLNLVSVPDYTWTFGTNAVLNGMFNTCVSLTTPPALNTTNVVNFTGLFVGCSNLTTAGSWNTASATAMGSMFNGCSRLTVAPVFSSTAAMTNWGSIFLGTSITEIPAYNLNSVTAYANYASTGTVSRVQVTNTRFSISYAQCRLAGAQLDEIYTNLPTITGQTITVTGNWGTATDTPSIATAKGWTVTGS